MESEKMEIRILKKGEVIFRQGDYEPCMYDILRGKVGIYAAFETDEEKLLTELESGKVFGEMGMIEGAPRSAAAVSLEDGTQIRVITSDSFSVWFKDEPERIYQIMTQLSRRIREMTGEYMEVCRAAAELTDAQSSGRSVAGWLKEGLKKWAVSYSDSMQMAQENGFIPYAPSSFGVWY